MPWMGGRRLRHWKHIAAFLCLAAFFLGVFGFHEACREEGENFSSPLADPSEGPMRGHPGITQLSANEAPRDHHHPAGTTQGSDANDPGNSTQARDTTLTPGPYPYVINEPDKCPAGNPPPFLVLLILTEAHEVEARNVIRRTWGNESLAPGHGIVRLFLLGAKKGGEGEEEAKGRRLTQESLEAESRRHHDILQQDFSDTYHNLTLKTLMGMNWVARHCPRAAYVMKTDSDVLVNTDYLVHELLRPDDELLKPPRTGYFTGHVIRGSRPVRWFWHKYYMPRAEYPAARYPDYCAGTGYVFSGHLAADIYGVASRSGDGVGGVPLIRFEDVYVGLCLARLGVEPTPPPETKPGGAPLFNDLGLRYRRCGYNDVVTVHKLYPTQQLEYWHRMQSDKHDDACAAAAVTATARQAPTVRTLTHYSGWEPLFVF